MGKLEKALDDFKNKKILVIGDVILDLFTWGKVPDRRNPEQPVAPLINIIEETYALGGSANVASNVTSLGGKCKLYGLIGEGQNGKTIKKMCEEKGIIFRDFYSENPTLMKQRVMAHGQQVARLDRGETNLKKINLKIRKKVINKLNEDLEDCDFIILSDYNKGFLSKELSHEIIDSANKKNIKTSVDPKPQNISYFKNCTVVTPNEMEAEKITNIKYSNGKERLEKMGKSLCEVVGSKYSVITCGADGFFSYEKKGNSFLTGTKAREVADVTGAGDTFAATLALGLASDLKLHDAALLANYAAGIVVEKIGTATVTTKEIKRNLYKSANS